MFSEILVFPFAVPRSEPASAERSRNMRRIINEKHDVCVVMVLGLISQEDFHQGVIIVENRVQSGLFDSGSTTAYCQY